jgi:hypothetical protein
MNVAVSQSETLVSLPAQEPKKMIQVSVTPEGKTLVKINSSSISIIQECLRKAQYSLHERWLSEVGSPATTFGSAIHKAMEVYYTGNPEERILPKYEDCEKLAYGQTATENNLILNAISAFVQKAEPLSALPEADKRSIQNGVWILYHYFKSYINDPYITYVDDKGPFVERSFEQRLFDEGDLVVDLFGTVDAVFRHVREDNKLVVDHKTTSALGFGGASYYDREKPNHQYTGYIYGVREAFGIQTEDFLVNVIEVKAKPKTARGSPPNFPRQITGRSGEDFIEFNEVVRKVVRDYLYAIKHSEWPLGPVDACNKYGSCTYKQVCSAPKSLRGNILSSKFKHHGGTT